MQLGIAWEPTMDTPVYIAGDKQEVVMKCQQRCKGTWGCEQFTVLFPNMCRLAGHDAAPLPAASATMSGPAVSRCQEQGYVGNTFMKKAAVLPEGVSGGGNAGARTICAAALVVCGLVMALARGPLHRERGYRGSLPSDDSPLRTRGSQADE